jgi:hypothetical protein
LSRRASTQKVDITAHYENAVGTSDAASQGTVRGERLTDLPVLRPGEVLETIPGMVVTQHSGDGKANQYLLRGYNLDHGTDFATCVDGVPVNMPINAHGQGYTDLNFLIPEPIFELRPATGDQFEQQESRDFVGAAVVQGWQHALFGDDSTTEVGFQGRRDHVDDALLNTQARVLIQTVSNDRVGETTRAA